MTLNEVLVRTIGPTHFPFDNRQAISFLPAKFQHIRRIFHEWIQVAYMNENLIGWMIEYERIAIRHELEFQVLTSTEYGVPVEVD